MVGNNLEKPSWLIHPIARSRTSELKESTQRGVTVSWPRSVGEGIHRTLLNKMRIFRRQRDWVIVIALCVALLLVLAAFAGL